MVDIYVGRKRKYYSLPKDLLAHYSGYFERSLQPKSNPAEGVGTHTIYLIDDDPDDFALIVDYILRGSILDKLPEADDASKVARCLRYIKLIGKLEIGEAAAVICLALKNVLVAEANREDATKLITPEFISTAFDIIPARSDILKILCQATLPENMKRRGNKYEKVIELHDGFAAETWRQYQGCRMDVSQVAPLRTSRNKKKLV
jgi:hypothetical protein